MAAPLPEFANPPVSEVALSVVFAPLENWRNAHAGLYWGRILDRYPHSESHPPVMSQVEKFDQGQTQGQTVRLEFSNLSNPDLQRVWFLSEPATRLLQIQRDRFTINWRKVSGDEAYPRYAKELRQSFEKEWNQFSAFLAEQKIGTPEISQCEVIYVNDMLKGENWEEFSEAMSLFEPWWKRGTDGFLPPIENLNLGGSFRMPEDRGRLHFAVQRVIRSIDSREAVQLQFIARGKPNSSDTKDILAWMDMGREWVVRGFADLTSGRAHKMWGRTA